MKNISVESSAAPLPYLGDLLKHPFSIIAEQYLRSIDIDPNQIRQQCEKEIVWSFCLNSTVSVAYRIYKDKNQEVFLHMECAFGIVPKGSEDLIASILLKAHHEHHFPFWFAITEDQLAVVMFRSFCEGITPEHFLLRLHSIITLGLHSNESYVCKELDLHPLPSSWFEKQTAA